MSKIYDFQEIEPKGVLTWFKRICSIPHGSGNEKTLCDMLAKELEKAGCKVRRFKTGAVLATKKATKGYEKVPSTLLQGHTDMILAQEEGLGMDLNKNPISAYYDTVHKWIKAEGTTLGADNGIGVAMIMEAMTNKKLEHGPLEALLTTGEEVDPSVCMASIPSGIFKSTNIINLDCDKEDKIFIGSGAFAAISVNKKLDYVPVKKGTKTYNIKIKNFTGGHSGLEIHNNHINAIKFISEIFLNFEEKHDISIVSVKAGTALNSIPKFVTIDVQIEPKYLDELKQILQDQLEMYLIITENYDKDVSWKIDEAEIQAKKMISQETAHRICLELAVIPNGTFYYSHRGDCMFSSSNIGMLSILDGYISFGISTRSFLDKDCTRLQHKAKVILNHFGVKDSEMTLSSGCSAWLNKDPDNSELVQLWRKNFISVYKKEPIIVPNPGGLEIAEIIRKGPQMEANSIAVGPRIWKEHTTEESCPVDTVAKLWKILTNTLKGMKK